MKTFVLTEDQEMLQGLARDLAQSEIAPRSESIDHEALPPAEGMFILAEAGLLACAMPESYGGAELNHWSQVSAIEEVAKDCASTAWAVAASAEVSECLLVCGTEAQRTQTIPELVSGAFAVADGGNGIRAEKIADGHILNGIKKNVPFVGVCSWYLISAAEGETIHWFLLKGEMPGLSTGLSPKRLGMKGCAMGELVLENCKATADMLVPGDVSSMLAGTQMLHMAAIAAGIAQGALNEAIKYVNQRVQFGKNIAQFENTQHVMAELLAKTEAARALVWDAAYVKDSGVDYAYVAAVSKLVASDTACVVTRKCVQFMGGYGYSREYPVERKMRDAKMTELCGGTSEAQKNLIARRVVIQ